MKIEAWLLYQLLSDHNEIENFGAFSRELQVGLPQFYEPGKVIREGDLLVCRSQALPESCRVACMFLCVGGRPVLSGGQFTSSIFYFPDKGLDILSLFSKVNAVFQQITDWQEQMEQLLREDAPVEMYVRQSLPLFQNGITITDYDLRVLANTCEERSGSVRNMAMDDRFERIPFDISTILAEAFDRTASLHEPFFYKGQRENPEGMNYCINLYLGDCYIGSCALWEKLHPLRESDYLLFQKFAKYIRRALQNKSRNRGEAIITLKSVFNDLLQCFPVNKADLNRAMEMLRRNLAIAGKMFGSWRCIVIESANHGKTLPAQYLCATVEDKLPYAYALPSGDQLVCFCMIPEGEDYEQVVCEALDPWFKDMNFHCGISDSFPDILDSQAYCREAQAVLGMGASLSPEQKMYRFEDYILSYMLQNCRGELSREMVISQGLRKLQELDSGTDYVETLRLYLDNECNAARTAQDLYLHRSSLMPRIEKIKTMVDLDTPEDRLYVRMCLAMMKGGDGRS